MEPNNCSPILVEKCHLKTLVTLNRPETLNSLTIDMIRIITKLLKTCNTSKSMIIMKGMGDKSFCAGGDVRIIVNAGPIKESRDFFREEYTLNYLISNCNCPYITFIDGITMGGGVGLSIHGTYSVATERTVLAMPEVAIGLFPDVGGTFFLPRLEGYLGVYLALTGHRLRGTDVVKAGLATHYCDSSKLCELEEALINCNDSSEVLDILNRFSTNSSIDPSFPHMSDIDRCFSENSVEEIMKALAVTKNEWATRTLTTMKYMSPLSLKITLRALHEGSKRSFTECLEMEYRIVVRCLENSDFREGVRALLIDKDRKPRWDPQKLQDVTDAMVNEFFAALPESEMLKL